MGQIKVPFPLKNEEEIWLGLDTPGFRRKVFRTVDKKLVNSEHIVAGLTVFEPGDEEVLFKAGEWMFIPTACSISTKMPRVNHFG